MPLLSKIRDHLKCPLNTHRLHDDHQSAYHTGHSTDNTLLKIHQDIAEALDNQIMAVLVLLDLSAAFDVVGHGILQKHPEYSFEVTGNVSLWIQSYLSDRIHCAPVCHKDRFLDHVNVVYTRNQYIRPAT